MNGKGFVYLISWLVAAVTIKDAISADGKYAQMLFRDLFESYSNALRPVDDTDKALNVTLQITLSQIKDVDERNQILTAYLWIRQSWYDAYLKWDKDKYDGLDSIRIPSSFVWRPDIVLYNKADDEFTEPVNTNVVLRYDGKIIWDAPAITKSSCVVDVSYFPFDNQRCNLTFGSWTYNGNQVDIVNAMDSGELSDFIENVEWEVHGMPAVRNVVTYGCCSEPYPDITYTLILKRRSSFYIFNLLIPCVLICFLAPLGFYLPADSGEKVSLGVTILLALTVFQLMVAESMPPSECVPLIGKYYIATMTLITASTALTIFIMNIHHCGPDAKPVPQWAEVIILDYMSKIFFVYEVGESCTGPLKCKDKDNNQQENNDKCNGNRMLLQDVKPKEQCSRQFSHKETDKKIHKNVENHFSGCAGNCCCRAEQPSLTFCNHYERLARNVDYIATCFKEQKVANAKGIQWKKVAKVMDRFFMWIFFVMVFFMSVLLILKAV
ncbi:neuronal acetylcholine receptor subunit alpha-9-like [Protopterus annectens]|uniref:neuronal acetylcholine receptor subunit alpha-9-like n=1 Tax=Protopterus annectens TaxID=7888 RepID=UPI001CF98904|nr:neuronal acetylcholine receptor subunit alpha-9-like [Protopterus annectens]